MTFYFKYFNKAIYNYLLSLNCETNAKDVTTAAAFAHMNRETQFKGHHKYTVQYVTIFTAKSQFNFLAKIPAKRKTRQPSGAFTTSLHTQVCKNVVCWVFT